MRSNYRKRVLGQSVVASSLAGIILYSWLLFYSHIWLVTLQVTFLTAVIGTMATLAWLGYTMYSSADESDSVLRALEGNRRVKEQHGAGFGASGFNEENGE